MPSIDGAITNLWPYGLPGHAYPTFLPKGPSDSSLIVQAVGIFSPGGIITEMFAPGGGVLETFAPGAVITEIYYA